jgi:hypothetical protein
MLSDEGSLKGKGSNIMLPAKGSPFRPAAEASAAEPVAFDAPSTTPALSGTPDLSPDDLARLFPDSAPVEAEPAPAWASFDVETPAEAAPEPQAAWANFNPSEAAPAEALSFEAPPAEGSLSMPDPTAPANEPMLSLEELAALNPSSHAEREGEGEGEAAFSMEMPGVRTRAAAAGEAPPGARTMPEAHTIAPDMAVPDRTTAGGAAVSGAVAFGGGGPLGHISEDVGPQREAYKRQAALKENDDLVKMFATDGRLAQRWNEIDALEQAITSSRMISHKPADELLDRLAAARNLLLNDRTQIEDAEREIAEVRFRWTRIEKIIFYEEPPWIFAYLILMSALSILAIMVPALGLFDMSLGLSVEALGKWAEQYAALNQNTIAQLWGAVVWGGIGGVTGAMYALWRHVADKKDYDPEFALWYYTNPLMGLMLGAFIYVVVQAGVLTFLQNSPLVLYILAWAVGFQQNIAFRLVNSVLDRLVPGDDKKKEEPKEKPKPADSGEAPGT